MTTFSELGLAAPLADALAAQGITEAFPIQALTLPDALAGKDLCGKAKTGSGKTLAFGLPMLQLLAPGATAAPNKPRALVLAPTRELAGQIEQVLAPLGRAVGLTVEPFYGGTPIEKQVKALASGVDVAVATPGRFIDLIDRKGVTLDDIEFVVVDEADRMADLGFLPQLEWILRHLSDKPRQTLLFSATLDGAVDVLIQRYLSDHVTHEVDSGQVTVEDMKHRFLKVHEMDRVRVLAAIARNNGRTIAFVNTKRTADRLTENLRKEGINVAVIHGDLRQQMREKALARFTAGELPILVATDVAARGIHIDDVDVVVHFDLPEDHKAYLHRSGRTARAGQTGVSVVFVLWNQEVHARILQRRLKLDEPYDEVFSNDKRLTDLVAWSLDSTSA